MNKREFLAALCEKLSGLPQDDAAERLSFYEEMIDDRVDEGMTEEEAVSGLGSTEEIMSQILSDIPLTKLVKERVKPARSFKAWEIVLLVLGCPLWLPLLLAVGATAFAVFIAVYAVIWSIIIALWAAETAFAVSAAAGIVACVVFILRGNTAAGLVLLGGGLVCAGIVVLMFLACKLGLKAVWTLSRKICVGVKSRFVKRGNK